jgi:tape measure domain-containing protein
LEQLAAIYVEITARADELTRVAARAQKDLQAVEAQADALAATGAFDEAAAKAQAIERSLTWMARRSPEAMGQVQGEVKQLTVELERLKRASEATKILRTLDDSMAGIGAQSSLLGRSYNAAAARADALKKAVVDLSKAGFSRQSKEVKDLTAEFKQATREAERHERAQRLLNNSIRGVKNLAKASIATFIGLTGAAAAFGTKAVQISGQIETMRVSWIGLTGSEELAQDQLERLKAFQRQTPFAFPEIESAAKQLVNYGFEIERVEELLKGMAAAAIRGGTGAAGLQGIATALGQMKSMGKVASQEINQLINAGVAAWPLMAEAMNLSVQELRDLMELAQSGKAAVPAERVIWGLVAEMSKGAEEMFGAYEDTLPGLTAKLADAVKGPMGLMAAVGKEIRESLQVKQVIRDITVEVERWTKAIQERGLRQAWEELAPPELRKFGDTVLQIANGLAHTFNVLRNHGLKGVWEEIIPDWVPGVATAIAAAIAGKAVFSIAASIGELAGVVAGAASGTGGIVAILGGMALWKWGVIAIAAAAAIYLIVKAVKALTKARKKQDSLPPFGSGMEVLLSWETGGKRAVQAARQTRDEVRDMYRNMALGVTDSSSRAADVLGVDFKRASDGMLNAMHLAEDAMPELAMPVPEAWGEEYTDRLRESLDVMVSELARLGPALEVEQLPQLSQSIEATLGPLRQLLDLLGEGDEYASDRVG